MNSMVRSRPSHYEALGIAPDASSDEIARAFAERISRPGLRPMAAATQIYAAYEVLRNADKRRAYDESLGLGPKAAPFQWTVAAARWNGMPFAMPSRANAVAQNAGDKAPARVPSMVPQPEPRTERPATAFVRASAPERSNVEETQSRVQELLRRLEQQQGRQERQPQPAPERQERQERQEWPEPKANRALHGEHIFLRAVEERLGEAEARPAGWNRTALIVGGLFAGIALVGAVAGTIAGGDVDAARSKGAVTLALPKPVPAESRVAAEPSPDATGVAPEWKPQRSVAARPVAPVAAALPPLAAEPEQADAAAADQSQVDGIAADEPVANSAPVEEAAARMPLPDAVIAQTIRRIGYACGEVASTRLGDRSGAFIVTCTSGHSYRASPIHGRYRFRRL